MDTLTPTLYNTSMRTVYLSIGSNIGDREANLRSAVARLKRNELQVVTVSSIYETSPVGETAIPVDGYLNIAAKIVTDLEPAELLHHTQSVEIEEGRTPTFHWGPRKIDIDIILFGDLTEETETLSIPHPRMQERAFVLIPLLEIDPKIELPGGVPVKELLDLLDVSGQVVERVGAW
ncbi:MAG: 2-amino-4-hydroxy-6-hydroxymethyldihydropteridine diphosphokinase [Chthonomonadales bacterium]